MEPLLSILIPSRYRFDRLKASINSYMNTISDTRNVEFIVKFDTDDYESYSRIAELNLPNIKYLVTNRLNGYNSMHDHANEMIKLCTGKWVLFGTDDSEILTKDWDIMLAGIKDEYVYLCPIQDGKYSEIYPFVTLKSCKDFGYFSLNHAVDRWLSTIYEGRKVNIDIEFRHLEMNDKSNEDRRNSTIEDNWHLLEKEIIRDKDYIKSKHAYGKL